MKKLLFALSLAAAAHAQVSPRPADAIVPVVGSTRGQSNANFKTELQLANPTDAPMSGFLFLRPQGVARRYELEPHTTLSFDDVVTALGATGLGSLDVFVELGQLPAIVARAYDDQPAGTTGATVPAIRAEDLLTRTDPAALIVPRDLTRYRFNAGIRALEGGVTVELVVRSAAGTERHRRLLTFPSHHFEQQPASFFAGIPLQPNDAIEVSLLSGTAIIYASTVDNVTNDSSLQVLRR